MCVCVGGGWGGEWNELTQAERCTILLMHKGGGGEVENHLILI